MKHAYIQQLPDYSDEIHIMVKERSQWACQMNLFASSDLPPASSGDLAGQEAVSVNFREIVSEIQDTSYLTHSLFYYPAKFIPHVPYYCVRHFCPENGWVIDPFAGSGTVGLEAVLANRNAVLLDINPLLKHIVELKINFRRTDIDESALFERIQEMLKSKDEFEPVWTNIDYWYSAELLKVLKRYWGWIYRNVDDIYAPIIQCGLLRASRRFSLADHKAPKLFRSRAKLREMEQLLRAGWQTMLNQFVWDRSLDTLRRVRALATLMHGRPYRTVAMAGVDASSVDLSDISEVDLVLTSPPYMQAQEYIRTFKLDLFWLGYSEEYVKAVSRLEIPYRKAPEQFHSPTFMRVYNLIERKDLRDIMNSYFYYTTAALRNVAMKLKQGGYLCVFVGNPRVDGIEVETWRIIAEYFEVLRFSIHGVYEDSIKNRQLFRGRRNKNPEGMSSEFLLIMRREW
ncbi:MAG: hypothetical protein KatS3mg019_0773 [Fimbriimonadales bacterium]|nr:MAG: hypothetical protein KatS3mg019_0773 [Fimbriimonadales bacterium]